MRMRFAGLVAAALLMAPASAQYYGGGYEDRGREVHVDRYRHGNHGDVVIHRKRRDHDERGFYGERRHHHHHHHDTISRSPCTSRAIRLGRCA